MRVPHACRYAYNQPEMGGFGTSERLYTFRYLMHVPHACTLCMQVCVPQPAGDGSVELCDARKLPACGGAHEQAGGGDRVGAVQCGTCASPFMAWQIKHLGHCWPFHCWRWGSWASRRQRSHWSSTMRLVCCLHFRGLAVAQFGAPLSQFIVGIRDCYWATKNQLI